MFFIGFNGLTIFDMSRRNDCCHFGVTCPRGVLDMRQVGLVTLEINWIFVTSLGRFIAAGRTCAIDAMVAL